MTAPPPESAQESTLRDETDWAKITRPTRWLFVAAAVAWLAYVGLSDGFQVCEGAVVVLDDGARFVKTEICRSPAITDAAVIAPAVLLALLLLPDVKVGFGGFSLERRIEQNQQEVRELRSDLMTVASSSASAHAVFNVGTSGLPSGASRRELQTWSAELIQAEMKAATEQLAERAANQPSLGVELQALTPDQIDLKVYLHQHDGALRAQHQYRRAAPDPGPFDVFAPGTGLVGYVSRHQVLRGVVGTIEVADPSDSYGMTEQQRSHLGRDLEAGALPSVIAGSPIWHPDSGEVIGVVSCDFAWPGVGEQVTSEQRDAIMEVLRRPLLQASANLAAIVVRLDPVR